MNARTHSTLSAFALSCVLFFDLFNALLVFKFKTAAPTKQRIGKNF